MTLSLLSSTFLGLDYETALLITVVVATLWTTLAMLGILFFAWAPSVSERWREQFGADAERVDNPQ